jgi:tetratricopeptide (TPR) repeat protein
MIRTKVKILLLILSFFSEITICAQDNLKAMDFCEANAAAVEALSIGDHAKALEYLTMAESISRTSGTEGNKLVAAVSFGKFYSDIHSLGDALKYYNKALDVITKNPEFERHRSNVLINIGSLYAGEEEFRTSLEYNQKAYDLATKDGTCTDCIVVSAENIADCYNNLGNYAQARKYLDKIKGLAMENMKRQAWKINYAESYLKEGRVGEAEAMMKGVLENVDSNTDNVYYLAVVELLSQINQKKGDIKNAVHFAIDGLKNSRSIKHTADMYELLSGIYYQDKQYEKAFKYKDSLLIARDSISRSINSSLYSTNKVKLKIQDYQTEAKYNKAKQESERNLFILIILLGTVLFYFIFRSLRNRIIKQKQLNTIADNNERIYELELGKLTNDIAEKNRKLSAKALYMSGRNQLIQEVINSLDQIPDIQQANVNTHIKTLRHHLKADEDWDNFITYFEQVNPNFLKSLQAKHPQLNTADIRFICYLYMNLDLKEIASMFSITIEASRKRKQRIAKKMDVDIDTLNYYIMKLG